MMKQLKAANDNTPERAVRDSERPIACPTLARFIKNENITGIKTLMYWRDLTKPGDPFNPERLPIDVVANDATHQQERAMNKLFSPRELEYLEAAANDNNGKPTFDEHGQAHLGGLTFQNGKCITPGVFNDENEFGKVRTTSSPNGCEVQGEEKYSSSFEAEQFRAAEEQNYRERLGASADVLDMACTDHTAEEIGRVGDESGRTAIRNGVILIDDALDKLSDLKSSEFKYAA